MTTTLSTTVLYSDTPQVPTGLTLRLADLAVGVLRTGGMVLVTGNLLAGQAGLARHLASLTGDRSVLVVDLDDHLVDLPSLPRTGAVVASCYSGTGTGTCGVDGETVPSTLAATFVVARVARHRVPDMLLETRMDWDATPAGTARTFSAEPL